MASGRYGIVRLGRLAGALMLGLLAAADASAQRPAADPGAPATRPPAASGQRSLPAVCSADGGAAIPVCPATCASACESLDFIRGTPRALELCPQSGGGRADTPACAAWSPGQPLPERVAARPQPVVPQPSPEECKAAEQQEDWVKVDADNAGDAATSSALQQFFRDLPDCLVKTRPPNLTVRLRCIGAEANQIDTKLQSTREQAPKIDQQNIDQVCQTYRQRMRTGNVMDQLRQLQRSVTEARSRFDSNASCLNDFTTWLGGREREMNRSSETQQNRFDRVRRMLSAVAQQASGDRTRIEQLFEQVQQQAQEMIDNAIDISLICPSPPSPATPDSRSGKAATGR